MKAIFKRRRPLFTKAMQMELLLIIITLFILLGLIAFILLKRFQEAGLT